MPKIARTLVGFGFIWMSLWATFGALMGARLNRAIMTEDSSWLNGLERALLRSAHAHMNVMSLALIGIGLSYVAARRRAPESTLVRTSLCAMGATIVFGCGLLLEAFFPAQRGALPWAAAVSATGGVVYLLTVGLWGMFFLGRSKADRPEDETFVK